MTLSRFAAAWLVGIALAERLPIDGAWPPAAAALALLAARHAAGGARVEGAPRSRVAGRAAAALAACALLGAARGIGARPAPHPYDIARLNDRGPVALRGRIVAEPDRRDWGVQYRVAVDAVEVDDAWRAAGGLLLAQASRYPLHPYGADVIVRTRPETPPVFDTFDYRAWLAQRGIHSVGRQARIETVGLPGGNPVRRALLRVKDRARRVLAACLPEPEASLATGILLGDARGIPARVDEAFRTTNTTHVIAISGSNVALLLAVLMATLGRLIGRRRAVAPALVALGLYTALVGADAAVVRAAVMGGVMLVGHFLGRPGQAATALMAAAWAMTLYRPGYIGDLGFQLSFAATVGLLLFSSGLSARAERALAGSLGVSRAGAAVSLLGEAVLVTLAAQVTTWPVIAHAVGQVSLVGLGANFLIVPAQGAVMALGGLTVLFGWAWEPAGRALGALAWLPLAYTIRVVEWTARAPLASVSWSMPSWALLAYYLALAAAASPAARERIGQVAEAARSPRTRAAALAAAAAACALAWAGAASRPDGLLHLHALDVGQGDALWLVTPGGRRVLVDGGPSPSAVLDGIGRRLAPWDRRIDVVVLTHPDSDHVGGLPAVLRRYRVGLVIAPPCRVDTPDAQAWQAALATEGARTVVAEAGMRLVLDEAADVRATVLWPPSGQAADACEHPNNASVTLRVDHGALCHLLPGDIEASVEEALLASGRSLDCAVLKVAHHGSDTSSTPGFLEAASPWLSVISVGAENRFGHPSADVVARLAPAVVRRTDRDGAVHVISDGARVWVR